MTHLTENWDWADEILANSRYSSFEVEDSEYNEESGEHRYFDEVGNMVVVSVEGKTKKFKAEDIE